MTDSRPGVEGRDEDLVVLEAVFLAEAVGLKCLTCPTCGAAPEPHLTSITWPAQAWCATDECAVLIWNPRASARENLDGGQEVRLEDPDPPATRPRRDDDFGQAVGDL